MSKYLIIQTAFIGDVILATSLVEFLKQREPNCTIDFLLRDGNQKLLDNSPHINKVLIWDKKTNKTLNLFKLLLEVRKSKYDTVICVQRFFNAGLLCGLSGSNQRVGFDSNPLSFLFTKKIKHRIPHPSVSGFFHEVQRNLQLLSPDSIPEAKKLKPKLYFSKEDQEKVESLKLNGYFVLAPSSVWYTKQWHHSKWKELIVKLSLKAHVVLIGAPSDYEYVSSLYESNPNITNLCGKLSLPQSALLMQQAKRVFVNDSAPLHLASAVNAPTTAIFCSTVPDFGYFPLSDDEVLIQRERLDCMPCGLHGKTHCPKVHFNCAMDIEVEEVMKKSFEK
jgi:heptosyltransferase-2